MGIYSVKSQHYIGCCGDKFNLASKPFDLEFKKIKI
jgi:hypothetical protein